TITIPAGQFRIFGNQASTLSIENPNFTSDFKIYPNPANHAFKINKDVVELNIYDITGKLVKTLKGNFTPNDSFDISELTQSLYLVKVKNNEGQVSTSKLIKL